MSSGPLIAAQFDRTGTYLASGIVSLDSHNVRVQSVNPSQSSLNTSFSLDSSAKLTTLAWLDNDNDDDQLLIALGLTNGHVLIYSPLLNEVVAELASAARASVTHFHYSSVTRTGWSADVGGNIYEWDMATFKSKRHIAVSDLVDSSESINRISSILYNSEPHLLLGSHSVYLVDLETTEVVKTFPAHIQPVNSITPVAGDDDLFLTSGKGDRFINLYSIAKNSAKKVFVALATVADLQLTVYDDKSSLLLAINENGNVEFFNDPLSAEVAPSPAPSTPSKKRRKQKVSSVQSHPSNGVFKLSRPEVEIKSPADANMPVNAVVAINDTVLYTWLENGNVSHFDSFKWLDQTGVAAIEGDKTFLKSRPELNVTVHHTKGHDVASAKHYNEANTIISEGTNFKDVSDNEEEEEETLADKLDKLSTGQKPKTAKNSRKKLALKNSSTTLTIVLSQALTNNDHTLLESVLGNRDVNIIQNTIARLDSSLAVVLLDRLAERIARNSTRFDQLNFWLKWIIIAHGGMLSSLPNLNNKLSNLHAILTKKANTLPRLLELQGRLNMLQQQTELKKEILNSEQYAEESSDDSDVEYVEELDDANLMDDGEASSDVEFDGVDDYEDSDDGMDIEEPINSVLDLDTNDDNEGYSDVEIGVENDDVMEGDRDDEEAASEAKLRKLVKKATKKK